MYGEMRLSFFQREENLATARPTGAAHGTIFISFVGIRRLAPPSTSRCLASLLHRLFSGPVPQHATASLTVDAY